MLRTKAELVVDIQLRLETVAGHLANIGGDCYAGIVQGEPRFAVALKQSTLKDKLWVGSPIPILNLLMDNLRLPGVPQDAQTLPPYRAFIALTHIPHKTLILIPIPLVYKDVVDRARATRSDKIRSEFHVRHIGYKKYAIQTDDLLPDIPIKVVDTLEPLFKAMHVPLAEL